MPVYRSTALTKTARQKTAMPIVGPIDANAANELFLRAADADPLDATASMNRAAWLFTVAAGAIGADRRMEALRLARDSLDEAVRRDPFNLGPRRMRTQLHRAMAEESNSIENYEAAIHAAEQALAIYPLDPDGWIKLGDRQAAAADHSNSPALRERAAASYERALELDDRRLAWESLRRLSPAKREEIESTIRRIRQE